MNNVPAISTCEQTPLQAVSEAITAHILKDIESLREQDGAGLSALLDEAILEGIDQAFSAAAHSSVGTWVQQAEKDVLLRLRFDAAGRDEHPHLADIVRDDFEATLTFYGMDANTWQSLRSINIIERFNREMRRRFDDMGACRGDAPVTRTAGLVAMRLAKVWEGKVVWGFRSAIRKKYLS